MIDPWPRGDGRATCPKGLGLKKASAGLHPAPPWPVMPAMQREAHPPLRPMPARASTFSRSKAAVAAAALWALFGLMVWLVQHGQTAEFDRAGLLLFRTGAALGPKGPPLLTESLRDLTALGGVLLRNLAALLAVIALIILRLRREAVLFAATVLSGWLVNSAIKAAVGRPRPHLVPYLTDAGGASFPSGHSFNAALVYTAMALAFAALSARRPLRAALIAGALAGSAAIAWTRVMLGVHYPSDVMAGWAGGAGWAFLAGALFYRPARALADRSAAGQTPDSGP